ncbi:ATP-grasp domain-containing protein [Candidatus Dojkabacteria bacterium]|nr:ATP-grasp domain-containing protein [Candidatus Dojkabacteria bacterium]
MQKDKDLLILPSVQNIDEIISGLATPVNVTKGKFSNLEFIIKDDVITLMHSGVDIKDFSNVWLSSMWGTRDLAFAVKLYLKHFNIDHTHVEKGTSKVTDQVIFTLNNIPTPNTYFISKVDITKHVEEIENVCGYPLIIKDITGFGGKNSVLVSNRNELIEKSAQLPRQKRYLYQSFIPNDYDWGILIANGKIVATEKRYHKEGEFRNNICNGSLEVFVEKETVPNHIKEMAMQANKALGLFWSRSDIIVDKNTDKAYMMEVNRLPGITSGTMEVSGAQDFLNFHLA